MNDKFPFLNFGLYRDDGLACHEKIPGPTLDRYRKDIIKLFQENDLQITIEIGLKVVNFLDVSFNLTEESYKPYRKPNDTLLYVNKSSNHPKTVLNQITNSVNHRLNKISSNKTIFDTAKTEYEQALGNSGHNEKLAYEENLGERKDSKTKHRKRNIVWYNPPFNLSLKTDLGRKFLKLIQKHFPIDHILRPIVNKNNVKLSYSTTKNIKRIMQTHNSKILKDVDSKKSVPEKTCSCPRNRKNQCPLQNRCLSKCIVYKATVEKTGHFYIGITENNFKTRLAKHKYSFSHESDKDSTTLSHHVWDIGENPEPKINWEILRKTEPRRPGSRECQLCLEEKLQILQQGRNPLCLNRRSELTNRCFVFHRIDTN